MSERLPVLTAPGAGEVIFFGGGRLSIKISSDQTAGAFVLIEDVMQRGKTTPLHVHATFDETFYVLEGELLLHIDGAEHVAAAGAAATAPRGTPHAFLVTSESARILALATPGDVCERFFREGGEVPADPSAPVPPLDIARVREAGIRTGAMEVLGPPPFEQFARAGAPAAKR